MNGNVDFFGGLVNNYNETLEESNFCGYAAGLYEKTQPLLDVQNQMIIIRQEKALEEALKNPNSPNARRLISNAYMNTIGINQFGWVNCDRFLRIPDDQKQHIMVCDAQNTINNDTKYTVFCKSTKVVTSLSFSGNDIFKTGYSGLPKGEEVVVIGLRINEGKVEVFQQEGVVGALSTITNPDFKETSLAEVRTILAS